MIPITIRKYQPMGISIKVSVNILRLGIVHRVEYLHKASVENVFAYLLLNEIGEKGLIMIMY